MSKMAQTNMMNKAAKNISSTSNGSPVTQPMKVAFEASFNISHLAPLAIPRQPHLVKNSIKNYSIGRTTRRSSKAVLRLEERQDAFKIFRLNFFLEKPKFSPEKVIFEKDYHIKRLLRQIWKRMTKKNNSAQICFIVQLAHFMLKNLTAEFMIFLRYMKFERNIKNHKHGSNEGCS